MVSNIKEGEIVVLRIDNLSNGMTKVGTIIRSFKGDKEKVKHPTKVWDLAERIGLATSSPTSHWLRTASKYPFEAERSLIDLAERVGNKDLDKIDHPKGYFIFLLTKYKSLYGKTPS